MPTVIRRTVTSIVEGKRAILHAVNWHLSPGFWNPPPDAYEIENAYVVRVEIADARRYLGRLHDAILKAAHGWITRTAAPSIKWKSGLENSLPRRLCRFPWTWTTPRRSMQTDS
jgi:hypothetical protein